MSHLTDETLARLVDESPTALEAAHLSVCGACRDELQAMHVQVAHLSELPELRPPAADWEKLEQRLAAEGLIRGRAPRRIWLHYGLRAAAAVALVLTGALAGRLVQPTSSPGAPLADNTRGVSSARGQAVPETAAEPAPVTPVRDLSSPAATDTRLASQVTARAPRTPEEALQAVRATESAYLDALTRFAELSGVTTQGDPAARLAALEGTVLTLRAALGKAPTDPVINGYYLNAVAQRDATIRQISATNSAESWF